MKLAIILMMSASVIVAFLACMSSSSPDECRTFRIISDIIYPLKSSRVQYCSGKPVYIFIVLKQSLLSGCQRGMEAHLNLVHLNDLVPIVTIMVRLLSHVATHETSIYQVSFRHSHPVKLAIRADDSYSLRQPRSRNSLMKP